MSRGHWATPAARALLAAAVCALAACSEVTNGTGLISQRIGEAVREPGVREVDIARFTTFGWDRVRYLPSGTPRDEVCRAMGANRKYCGRVIRYDAVPADAVTLLFWLDGQLTHTELHALANGRLDFAPGGDGLPRASAVFRVVHRVQADGHDDIVLAPR